MTQQEDVETVKRAADKQNKCKCATPKRDSLLGRTQCIECQGVITSDMEFELVSKPAGRMVEGDIVTRGLPVDEGRAPRTTASVTAVTSYEDDGRIKACHMGTDEQWHNGEADKCMSCTVDKAADEHDKPWDLMPGNVVEIAQDTEYNAVTPPHYQRGPRVALDEYDTAEYYDIQCMDVMRCMQDPRLATAFKYIWRVAFGGKSEPWDSRSPAEVDARDISSAIWYLQDYLANPPEALADNALGAYTPEAIGRPAPKD